MASSSEAENSSTLADEPQLSHVCSPCETDGHKLKAVGYCVTCKENLCRRCYDVHLIPTPMKKHKLLDEEHMSEIDAVEKRVCPEHTDKPLEYHCPTHTFFGCHVCSFKHQKTCKDVKYIPEVSEDISNTELFKQFNKKLADIIRKCTDRLATVNTNKESTEANYVKAISGIKEFKNEKVLALDKREKELLEKAEKLKHDETTKTTEVYEKCSGILMRSKALASRVELLQSRQGNLDLYMTIVQSQDTILTLEDDLRATDSHIHRLPFTFSESNELTEMLKSPFCLGTLHQTDTIRILYTIRKVEHIQDINIKQPNDTICRPVCSVLLPDQQLVIVDSNNAKVKLLDIRQTKIKSELALSGGPWGICKINDDLIVVTLPSEKKVAFVRYKPSLSLDRTIQVNGICRGVGYCDGKLVVSYDSNNSVEVMDTQGTVLKSFKNDTHGQALFSYPYQLTINQTNKLIYVSNYSSNDVICMDFDGTVVTRYVDNDNELRGPWQTIFTSKGVNFLCGQGSNTIYQMTADFRKEKSVLTNVNGLATPESLTYCEKEDKLYVGMQTKGVLKVFKVFHATL